MDANGIDIQVLSLTVAGIQADTEAASAVSNARLANDYLADAVACHPGRFRGFAAADARPVRAGRELEWCVRDLSFVGTLVNNHTQGRVPRRPGV